MATKVKKQPKRKPQKRGPKQEVLVITRDPEEALADLMKPKPSKKR